MNSTAFLELDVTEASSAIVSLVRLTPALTVGRSEISQPLNGSQCLSPACLPSLYRELKLIKPTYCDTTRTRPLIWYKKNRYMTASRNKNSVTLSMGLVS